MTHSNNDFIRFSNYKIIFEAVEVTYFYVARFNRVLIKNVFVRSALSFVHVLEAIGNFLFICVVYDRSICSRDVWLSFDSTSVLFLLIGICTVFIRSCLLLLTGHKCLQSEEFYNFLLLFHDLRKYLLTL